MVGRAEGIYIKRDGEGSRGIPVDTRRLQTGKGRHSLTTEHDRGGHLQEPEVPGSDEKAWSSDGMGGSGIQQQLGPLIRCPRYLRGHHGQSCRSERSCRDRQCACHPLRTFGTSHLPMEFCGLESQSHPLHHLVPWRRSPHQSLRLWGSQCGMGTQPQHRWHTWIDG